MRSYGSLIFFHVWGSCSPPVFFHCSVILTYLFYPPPIYFLTRLCVPLLKVTPLVNGSSSRSSVSSEHRRLFDVLSLEATAPTATTAPGVLALAEEHQQPVSARR